MAYMDLTASDVRSDAMPPTNRGASDSVLDSYISEWQTWLTRQLGELPADDVYLRGILRDLAGASGSKKVASDQEAWDRADRQEQAAMNRLASYPSSAAEGSSGGTASPADDVPPVQLGVWG